jgi:hypothetical protein
VRLTVAARLDRSLDVADTLDGHAVLVVAVDILVLKLTNLVDQHTKLVRDVRHIIVASLAPDGELLLQRVSVVPEEHSTCHKLTATSMRSLETSSMLRITFFSILTSCESFFARSGPNAPADLWRKV